MSLGPADRVALFRAAAGEILDPSGEIATANDGSVWVEVLQVSMLWRQNSSFLQTAAFEQFECHNSWISSLHRIEV